MSYKVKVTPHGEGSYFQTGFSSLDSAYSWAKSFKDKGPYTKVKLEIIKEAKMVNKNKLLKVVKLIESNFDKNMKLQLKDIYNGKVPSILKEDFETTVDKETWNPESEKEIDNSKEIEVDGESTNKEESEESVSALDYLLSKGVEEPEVLTEFDELSNEDKKQLLLKLAKNDNNLDTILKLYLDGKFNIDEDSNDGSKPWLKYMKDGTSESEAYAIWATEQGGND